MKEIRDKLSELASAYQAQLGLYKKIEQVGSGEQQLIQKGRLEQLLEVLKEKEKLLKQAGDFEKRIQYLQEQLVTHFEISTFSLPQLKLVAPAYYQDELEELESTVAELLPVLEALEEQERRNEASLSQYLGATQEGPQSRKTQIRLAGRAYGKKQG